MPKLLDERWIPHWHRAMERFMGILRAHAEPIEDNNLLIEQMTDAFDIETATGAQLDMIGRILNINRTCNMAPDYEYRTLNDDLYRFVLMARMLYAGWDGTIEGFYHVLDSLFPDVPHSILDRQDGSFELLLDPELSYDKPLHILFTGFDLLPHPVGVGMDIGLRFRVEQPLYTYHAAIVGGSYALGTDNADPSRASRVLRDETSSMLADENGVLLFDEEG